MIQIENLTFTYPGAEEPTLKNLSVEIEQGDFLAIVGNNGCGKSTFCKTLNGLIPHFTAGDMEGKVVIGGLDTRECEIGDLAQKIGYVYQDFENQIVRPTVLDDASFACLNFAVKDYEEKGRRALEMCGIAHKADEYIWQLSGGQKHLLALAGAAALSPDILVLDEPIAQLDPAHARDIYEVLKTMNEVHGKTIIVIEHHTEYIAQYCRHVMLMRNGSIAWKLPAREALCRVEELQKSNIFPPQVTLAADRMAKGMEAELPVTVEEGKNFFCRYPQTDAARAKILDAPSEENTILEFENVSVEYRSVKGNPIRVLNDFNLEIHKGEKIAVIGSNGAGKSTIMKLMCGLLKPSEGSIILQGQNIKEMEMNELSQILSLVYQNPEEMFIKDSIRRDIEFAMKVRNVENYQKRTEELLERFQLTDLQDRDGRLLSGGQMRRASLAIGIALNPSVLLLDEPTANLDIATRKEILRTLSDMKSMTDTVMIATHDMQLVCEWAERILVLSGGKLLKDGTREEVFNDREVVREAGIQPPEIYQMGKEIRPEISCYTVDEFLHLFQREAV